MENEARGPNIYPLFSCISQDVCFGVTTVEKCMLFKSEATKFKVTFNSFFLSLRWRQPFTRCSLLQHKLSINIWRNKHTFYAIGWRLLVMYVRQFAKNINIILICWCISTRKYRNTRSWLFLKQYFWAISATDFPW